MKSTLKKNKVFILLPMVLHYYSIFRGERSSQYSRNFAHLYKVHLLLCKLWPAEMFETNGIFQCEKNVITGSASKVNTQVCFNRSSKK